MSDSASNSPFFDINVAGPGPISGFAPDAGGFMGDILPPVDNVLGALETVAFFGSKRTIAGVLPTVAIQEEIEDELETCDHPVEIGAPITDHSFIVPTRCTMQIAFGGPGGRALVLGAYELLLTLRDSRKPFDIVTGKRILRNMMLVGITQQTDANSENMLAITARFRQVLFVYTQETSVKPETLADPARTQSGTDSGSVSEQPVSTSDQPQEFSDDEARLAVIRSYPGTPEIMKQFGVSTPEQLLQIQKAGG